MVFRLRVWLFLLAGAAALGVLLVQPRAPAPQSSSKLIASARDALTRDDPIAAQVYLARALRAGAKRADVAAGMGEALLAQNKLADAARWLENADFAPSQATYGLRMLGRLQVARGDLPSAGAAYDRALAINSADSSLWVDIGRLRYLGGEHVQAIEAADRALATDSANPLALVLRAQLIRDAQGPASALPAYRRAAELAPDKLEVQAGYAATLSEAGEARQALAVIRNLANTYPKAPTVWFLQAALAARGGKDAVAKRLLQRGSAKLVDVPAAQLLGAVLELEAGNANLAAGMIERLANRQPANQRLQLLLAKAIYESGDQVRLERNFGGVLAGGDAPVYLLTILARSAEDRGDRVLAAALLDRAASARGAVPFEVPASDGEDGARARWDRVPWNVPLAAVYVRSLIAGEKLDAARTVADEVFKLRPGSVDSLMLRGDVALLSDRSDTALESYLPAASVRFPDPMLNRVALAFSQSGRDAESREVVARYLHAFPWSLSAAKFAARDRLVTGDPGRARAIWYNLLLRGGNRDARLLADLSKAQLDTGNPRSARESARRAYYLQRGSALGSERLAAVLAKAGDDGQSVADLRAKAAQLASAVP